MRLIVAIDMEEAQYFRCGNPRKENNVISPFSRKLNWTMELVEVRQKTYQYHLALCQPPSPPKKRSWERQSSSYVELEALRIAQEFELSNMNNLRRQGCTRKISREGPYLLLQHKRGLKLTQSGTRQVTELRVKIGSALYCKLLEFLR